jgi:hypothetical protein
MKQLYEITKSHRQGFLRFLAYWVILWGLTIATWMFDSLDQTMGMPPAMFNIHLLLPLAPGFLVGWRTGGGLKTASLAGLLTAALDFLALLLWGLVLMILGKTGTPDPQHSGWGGALEALIWGAAFVILGAVLGLLGGWVGRQFSRRAHSG